MARPISNRDDEVKRLYEQGLSIEEVAELTGYATSTTKIKLCQMDIYDPALTKEFLARIWPEWEKACDRIRKGGME